MSTKSQATMKRCAIAAERTARGMLEAAE